MRTRGFLINLYHRSIQKNYVKNCLVFFEQKNTRTVAQIRLLYHFLIMRGSKKKRKKERSRWALFSLGVP